MENELKYLLEDEPEEEIIEWYSELLEQNCTWNRSKMILKFDDGAEYGEKELKELLPDKPEIIKLYHFLKKKGKKTRIVPSSGELPPLNMTNLEQKIKKNNENKEFK